MEQRTAPSREELAAEIASLAEVSSNFDQVRSILVAKDGELVHEKYSTPTRTPTGTSRR